MNDFKEILNNCFNAGRRFENGNHPRQTFEEWYEANDIEAKVLKISSNVPVSGELADFVQFLADEYSIEIHKRIIDEWNKYYSANYR